MPSLSLCCTITFSGNGPFMLPTPLIWTTYLRVFTLSSSPHAFHRPHGRSLRTVHGLWSIISSKVTSLQNYMTSLQNYALYGCGTYHCIPQQQECRAEPLPLRCP